MGKLASPTGGPRQLFGYRGEAEVNRLYRARKLLKTGAGTAEIRKVIIAGAPLRL